MSIPTAKITRTAECLVTLAEPTRLALMFLLADAKDAMGVADLASFLEGRSSVTIGRHLSRLLVAGMVDRVRQGNVITYALTPEGRLMAILIDGMDVP